MKNKFITVNENGIKDKILSFRGLQVILDSDLAEMYDISVKALNQAVKRNRERFPSDFMFQLTKSEKNELVTNCDHLKNLKFSPTTPYVFTEQGVASLSGVLKSKKAIEINIKIMRAFVAMRKFISKNVEIFYRLDLVERKQLEFEIKTHNNFEKVFDALQTQKPKQGIFFDGQVFDAYQFASNLIRSAHKSIILIDNYIDDSVLTLFSKRKKNVEMIIYTKNITKQLELDLEKYHAQYAPIIIKKFDDAHDRFLILDDTIVYHFGASLKDLGKKWFAFSKFDKDAFKLLERLKRN